MDDEIRIPFRITEPKIRAIGRLCAVMFEIDRTDADRVRRAREILAPFHAEES